VKGARSASQPLGIPYSSGKDAGSTKGLKVGTVTIFVASLELHRRLGGSALGYGGLRSKSTALDAT
jgi:hypothetical protein